MFRTTISRNLPALNTSYPRLLQRRCIPHTCTSISNSSYREFSTTGKLREIRYVRFEPQPGYQGRGGGEPPKRPLDYGTWGPKTKMAFWISIASGVYYVAHLEQVPQTGRWRFMNTSPRFEQTIGDYAREQVRSELQGQILPINHPITRHVRRVVSRILEYSDLGSLKEDPAPTFISRLRNVGFSGDGSDSIHPDADYGASAGSTAYGPDKQWDVIVVNDNKMINAMAVPGLVIVFTGILPICQDEQGLAAVVAHEIGHVVARHTAERVSSQTVFLLFMVILQTLGIDYGISSAAQNLLLALPNSRVQEREADMIGLRLMSRACYNPRAAPEMFDRLGQVESKVASKLNVEFMRTHPSSANRVKYLEKALPEGYAILESNPDCDGLRSQYEGFRDATREIKVDPSTGGWMGLL